MKSGNISKTTSTAIESTTLFVAIAKLSFLSTRNAQVFCSAKTEERGDWFDVIMCLMTQGASEWSEFPGIKTREPNVFLNRHTSK